MARTHSTTNLYYTRFPNNATVTLSLVAVCVLVYLSGYGWSVLNRRPGILMETAPTVALLGWLCLPVNLLMRLGVRQDFDISGSVWYFVGGWLFVSVYWACVICMLLMLFKTRRVYWLVLLAALLLVSAYGCYHNFS
jgi:hypothetical protein